MIQLIVHIHHHESKTCLTEISTGYGLEHLGRQGEICEELRWELTPEYYGSPTYPSDFRLICFDVWFRKRVVFYLIVSPFVARRVNIISRVANPQLHVTMSSRELLCGARPMNPMNPDENFQAQLPLLFLRFVLQPARLLAAVVPHPRVEDEMDVQWCTA